MAVLTLEHGAATGASRAHRRAPLAWFLGLLLILMIGSSTVLAHRNVDAAIPLDAAAVVVGPGGELTRSLRLPMRWFPAVGCFPECRTVSTWRVSKLPGSPQELCRR